SKTSVFNKMFYSTVQNHLGELVITIAKYSNSKVLEQEIWQIISQTVEDIFNHMIHISKQHLNNIKRTIFASEIDYKCVTTMRLEDQAHEYTYIKVNNPLHRKNDL
ncbi:MAG: IucA/IucC family C-terminal-domain containing protein, partial [Staphylococcus epidermidis]|nr:IucA/IucC family C-terminal-domain containing protein [Staphylococcus epidermidis]MDU3105081.1 IucA/IucC family C-terminal-domain containing protein [Staphylococcus epidermidis]